MASSANSSWFFFFNDTATTEIYTLSLHDALPISDSGIWCRPRSRNPTGIRCGTVLSVRRARPRVRPERAGWLELEGVDHGAWDHRSAGLDGQPGDTGFAPVQAAIRAAGAFGVDAEHMTFCQHAQAGLNRLLARHSPAPVHRKLADAGEEGLAEQSLDPAPREVLRLGQEDHFPRHRQR